MIENGGHSPPYYLLSLVYGFLMDIMNLSLSIIAIIISIMAIIFGRRQHAKDVDRRNHEVLSEVLSSFSRFKQIHEVMLREREKTGAEMDGAEKEIFTMFKTLETINEELTEKIIELLKGRKFTFSEQDWAQILIVKQHCDAMSNWVELRYDRFKRYNDNRVTELKDSMEKLSNHISYLKTK